MCPWKGHGAGSSLRICRLHPLFPCSGREMRILLGWSRGQCAVVRHQSHKKNKSSTDEVSTVKLWFLSPAVPGHCEEEIHSAEAPELSPNAQTSEAWGTKKALCHVAKILYITETRRIDFWLVWLTVRLFLPAGSQWKVGKWGHSPSVPWGMWWGMCCVRTAWKAEMPSVGNPTGMHFRGNLFTGEEEGIHIPTPLYPPGSIIPFARYPWDSALFSFRFSSQRIALPLFCGNAVPFNTVWLVISKP